MKFLDWFFLSLLIFIPRLSHLDVFLTADEPLFLAHARDFANGLASGDLSRTLGIGYPGVTVAAWSAPVVGPVSTGLAAYTAGRLATGLATGMLLLILYGLARSLLGRWPALLGVGLLALDPYTLGYGRLLHIAAPLALFMTLAGVAWLLWLRDEKRRWLLPAGIFTGLALLTKSTALLLGPMLGAVVFGWALVTTQWRYRRWWRRQVGGFVAIMLMAAVVFFALWPAMWSQPAQALDLTFGKLLNDQEAGAGNLGLFWLGRFVEDPGPAFYPVAFLLKATPWLLLGLALSLWQLVAEIREQGSRGAEAQGSRGAEEHGSLGASIEMKDKEMSRITDHAATGTQASRIRPPQLPITISLWLFALTYLIIMTVASKKSIRYMLPAFPTFYLLAGLAFYQLVEGWKAGRWTKKVKAQGSRGAGEQRRKGAEVQSSLLPLFPSSPLSLSQPARSWFIIAFFTLAIALPLFYHPYYLTYFNPLLLGWRWAPQTLLVGWGEGLDQAAAYLNRQPASTVSAWYDWLFPSYYKGQVEAVVPQENLITADHAVLYINQVQRDIPGPNIIHYFRVRRQPEHIVRLAGIDYAWVYPGPIASLSRPDPNPQYPLGGDFGGETRLLGYDLHPQPRSGESLIVTLYWRVLARPAAERFVYLRLVDPQGHIWTTADSPPVMGLWPIERWQPGMLIEDAQALPVPAGTPPGTYRLEVGLYDPASGQTLSASGQPIGQGGGLLLGEVQVEWQALRAEPGLPDQTEVRLAPDVHLVGYTRPLTHATTGDVLPIQLAWREAATLPAWLSSVSNDLVVFEWRDGATGQPLAEQLDSLPLPVDRWGHKALLSSQHDVIVPPTLARGAYGLWVMLHTGSDPAGEPFLLGAVEVTAPPRKFALPAKAIATVDGRLSEGIALTGYDVELTASTLDLNLYWQTDAPIPRRYKVFAQLLAADNSLLAQSDGFPAAGLRPTTGWLPGEIITDPHALTLSADLAPGSYRLIAGLYNPLNGERLPHLDAQGEVVGDFITVAEVVLP